MTDETEKSIAHKVGMNHFGIRSYPDGLVPWRPDRPPELKDDAAIVTGRLRSCSYCGSMHPADVAEAIRKGARFSWADFKYGWPHKAYGDDIPNPHAGMLEVRACSNHPDERFPRVVHEKEFDSHTGERLPDKISYTEEPRPAREKTHGKFYTVHLQDATEEDRKTIEAHLGLAFTFLEGGSKVTWKRANHE